MTDLLEYIKKMQEMYGDDVITTADKINRPEPKKEVKEIEAINEFVKRNPKAGGGMLVKPSADGLRPGYSGPKKKNLPKGVTWNKQKNNYRVIGSRGGERIQKQYGKSTWGSWKNALDAATKDAKEFFEKTPRNFGDQSKPNLTADKLKDYIKDFKKENKILPNKTNIRNNFNTSNKVIESILEKNPKIKVGTSTLTDEVKAARGQRAKDFATKNKTDFWTKNQPIDVSTGDVYDLDKYLNLHKTTRLKVDKVTLGIYDEIKPKNNKIYKSPFGTQLKNRLLTFMYRAAVHAENRNIKNPNYILIYDNKKLVGVEDVRLNTVYGTSTKNTIERGHTPIAKHPDYGKITEFVTLSKKSMSSSPKVLESYFLKNSKLPSYAEIYNYMYTRPGAKKDLSGNPLHFHHQALVEIEPSKYGQLLLADKNKFIDSQYRKYKNNTISLQEFDKSLKDLKTRFRLPETGKFIGALGRDIAKLPTQVAQAKRDIVSEFKKRALKDSDYGIKLQQTLLNNIQANSKLDECRLDSAEGGRIGFKFSTKCIKDGLNETKKKAAAGDKKAARQLLKTAEVATRGRLLKNILGPGAILGEAVYEGALIGNKVLGGKPSDIAWAESYLSYLDPRKYRGELDPLKMEREDMLESTADKNILRSGFAAQDQISDFNKAIEERDRAKKARRLDQYNPAAADAREQGRLVDQSADIISSEAFKDATNVAQEYLQGQAGKQMADFGIFSVPQSAMADEGRRVRAMTEMRELNPFMSDQQVLKQLKKYNLDPKDYDYTYTPRNFPADTSSKPLTGFDDIRNFYQKQLATQNIADAGGVANLAGGGIAGLSGGIDQGPQRRSMNPDSQGLRSLIKNGRKL